MLLLITYDGNILSFSFLEKIVMSTLWRWTDNCSGWCLSGQFTSPFPLIGRLVNWTVWREKSDVTFVFKTEMWSLTCLSKPYTWDLNKTPVSWSSSSLMICVNQVCDIVGGERVSCCHHEHNKTQPWVTIKSHTFSDEDVTSYNKPVTKLDLQDGPGGRAHRGR